ncbi:major facilitator superfamily domain-containing protein [Achaetomium macrosporum]|uniref:Major facilitator superfamily domain-containing protein n=1 Tax=Achaetomium macrosporum TaxID=79813 RepID=A0AAN7C9U6_9PEZI|nr:major facilitator superfamily domain-containing protein [Achaetomium macrosporum]
MATFTAAAVQSVFAEIAADLGVSIHRASSPSSVGNVGCAVSSSYATMALCRAITAFFISPASAIGSGVVTETFSKKERARYMDIWTIMVTLGVPMAPFIFGFVAVRVGYRWIYWILAITNGLQFTLYFILGHETLYLRGPTPSLSPPPTSSNPGRGLLSFRRLDPTPLQLWDFVKPLTFFGRPCVVLPTVAYAMAFLWANIMMSVETGSLFPENFSLDPQAVGLQNIAVIVGFLSDWWMWRRHHAKHLASLQQQQGIIINSDDDETTSMLFTITGVAVYLAQAGAAGHTWNISPDVGMGLAAAGNWIVTTVMTTYAVDCYRDEAASVGVFINFVR